MLSSRTFSDYSKIIELDHQLYPTENIVTLHCAQAWYAHLPELCFALTQGTNDVGLCVWIPLNQLGWSKMRDGALFEHGIQSEHLFNPQEDCKLFLHLYHIEKLSTHSIWQEALLQTNARLNSLNLPCEVCGMSAYCTTLAGIYLTTKKWGWYELGFKSNEYIINSPVNTITKNLTNEEVDQYISQQVPLCRCMFVGITKEDEENVVWRFINKK